VQTLHLFEQTIYVRDQIDIEVPCFYTMALGPLGFHTDLFSKSVDSFHNSSYASGVTRDSTTTKPHATNPWGLPVKARLLEIPANPNCPSGLPEYSGRFSSRYSPPSGGGL